MLTQRIEKLTLRAVRRQGGGWIGRKRPDGNGADGRPNQGPEDKAALLYRRLDVHAGLLRVLRMLEARRQRAAAGDSTGAS